MPESILFFRWKKSKANSEKRAPTKIRWAQRQQQEREKRRWKNKINEILSEKQPSWRPDFPIINNIENPAPSVFPVSQPLFLPPNFGPGNFLLLQVKEIVGGNKKIKGNIISGQRCSNRATVNQWKRIECFRALTCGRFSTSGPFWKVGRARFSSFLAVIVKVGFPLSSSMVFITEGEEKNRENGQSDWQFLSISP